MKEESAYNVEGVLIFNIFDKTPMFRKYNTDGTFIDYLLTHPDLGVKIIDMDAAFYEIDGEHYIDISSDGMSISKTNENE